jgi:hypothetical protein
LFGPGVKRPGEVLDVGYSNPTPSDTTSSTTFVATTTTVSVTPKSAANLVLVRASGLIHAGTGATQARARLSRGNTAATNLIGTEAITQEAFSTAAMEALDAPATTSAQAYYVQFRRTGGSSIASWGGGIPVAMTASELMG